MGALGKGIKKYRVLKNWEEGEERKGRGGAGRWQLFQCGVLENNATACAVAAGSANGTDIYAREVQEDAAKKAKGGVRRARRGRGRKERRGTKLRMMSRDRVYARFYRPPTFLVFAHSPFTRLLVFQCWPFFSLAPRMAFWAIVFCEDAVTLCVEDGCCTARGSSVVVVSGEELSSEVGLNVTRELH